MFKFTDYVLANEIWPTAKVYVDKGPISGYVRGYNIEVTTASGTTDWLSCSYIYNTPEEYFNDAFHLWWYKEHGWVPTGRICFRGYGIEAYDHEERDYFVEIVEDI